jgi:hypothetical protein
VVLAIHHNPARGNSRRVLLAIPSYGPVSGHTAFSLFRCHPTLKDAGYEVEARLLLGDCHVDDARNTLAADFLDSSCDDLVFIDADIGFQDTDLLRLLGYDRDIVGGAYPKKSDNGEFTGWLPEGQIWADSAGLIEMRGMATGFLRIRRPVIEALAATAQRYLTSQGRSVPMIFERLIVDGLRYSGDVAFCHKARQAGFKVWADPDAYLEHRGEKSWVGTLGSHLKRLHGIALSQELGRIRAGTETDKDYFDLMLQWGNQEFAAGPELLKGAVMVARQVKGVCLETGSGLSTLVMAAANPALTIHALEHGAEWAARVRAAAQRLGLSNVVVHDCPLIEYPAGRWYELPRLPWGDVEMVLCDGPPRQEGNRRILFGVMATHDCRPRCILVDDATTEADAVPAEYRTEIKGQLRQFAVGLRD